MKEKSIQFHLNLHQGHDNVARVLIELGADLDAKTEFGDTPLDTAKRYRNVLNAIFCIIPKQLNVQSFFLGRDDIVAIPEAFQKRERSDSDAQ